MVKTKITVLFLLCWAVNAVYVYTDTIVLKDGKVIQGKVLPKLDEKLRVRTEEGITSIAPTEIQNINYDENLSSWTDEARNIYQQRNIEIGYHDLSERSKLIQFCLDNQLYREAIKEIEEFIIHFSSQHNPLKKLLQQAKDAHFKQLIHQANWWVQTAHNPERAMYYLEKTLRLYPIRMQKQSDLFRLTNQQINNQATIERFKKKLISHESENFLFYYPNIINISQISTVCENIRKKILEQFEHTGMPSWIPKCHIIILPTQQEYLQASLGIEWSIARSHITRIRSKGHLLAIKDRTIICFAMKPEHMKEILAHEITHVILQDFLGLTAEIPLWISEGISDYITPHTHIEKEEISAYILQHPDRYPAVKSDFYYQSAKLVRHLIELVGLEPLLNFAFLISTGDTFHDAFNKIYPKHLDKLEEWGIKENFQTEE